MTPPSSGVPRGIGLRRDPERGPILGALMLATALVALDATILATAATTVARELGAFAQVPWLFSGYTLAQAVTVPLYGRLADIFGRKRMMLIGIVIFLVGSVFCAVAWSMPALVAGRVVQGLGSGAIMPVSMTILSDIYSLAERAKTQGYLASVWAISSVLGPALGGVFSQFVSWRWIFWVKIPLGLWACLVLWRRFHERGRQGDREPIDLRGAFLLTAGSALLVGGLLEGGTWGWASPGILTLLGAAVLLLVCFVLWARRAPYPIFDLRILRRRVVSASMVASLMVGVLTLGLTTYVPIFSQGVLGIGPLLAGFSLAPLLLGWPLAAAFAGRLYLRIGFRRTALIGSSLVIAGAALLLLLDEGSAIWHVGAPGLVIGLGMGLTAVPTLIAAQTSASWSERGAVTGTNMFTRSLGSALGVALFGAVVNASTTAGPDGVPSGPGLADALHLVFWGATCVAVVLILAVAALPREGRPGQAADVSGA